MDNGTRVPKRDKLNANASDLSFGEAGAGAESSCAATGK
jgi:hypothetical protein